jgi:hypothetical protein
MQFFLDRILTVNLILSTLVFSLAARFYVWPRLGEIRPEAIILPILLLHAMRHLGLMFLTRGAVLPGMPLEFARPAAWGDFATAILALAALGLVRRDFRSARPLLWTFNIVGTVDLVVAITLATTFRAPFYMGAAYWIPAFWVPLLLVTHGITFVVLFDKGRQGG